MREGGREMSEGWEGGHVREGRGERRGERGRERNQPNEGD